MVLPKSNKTSLKFKFILLIVSLTIGFALSECIVRILKLAPEVITQIGNLHFVDNTKIVYEYIPGSYVDTSLVNKQGFCDTDFVLEKANNLVRIAMLGDSITKGSFVDSEKTFSHRLELLLNQKAQNSGSAVKYEVMNFGVGGYNLEAEVEVLKEKALKYKPDIVVLNMYSNDNEPIPGIDLLFVGNYAHLSQKDQIALVRKYVYNRNSPWRWFERSILYKSKLYLFMITRIHSFNKGREDLTKVANIHAQTFPDMSSIYRGFAEISKLKKQYGFKFLICIHSLFDWESPNNAKFAAIADSFNFDYFYMNAYYKKEGVAPLSLRLKDHPKDSCHPNELGHDLIAQAMFIEFKEHDLIDSKL